MQTQSYGENPVKENTNKLYKSFFIINYEYPPIGGGGGIATKVFAEELVRNGHKVTVLTSHFKGLKFKETLNSVQIHRVPVLFRHSKSKASLISLFSWPLTSIIAGILIAKNNNFDLINTHFIFPTGITGYIVSKIFKIPNILYIHGADIYDPERPELTPSGTKPFSKLLKDIAEIFLNDSKGVVCQSNDTKSRILNLFPALGKKINIIPLPFNKPDVDLVSREKDHHIVNTIKIISIGRFVKRKGYKYLLEALSVLPKYINFELILIGEGPIKNDLIVMAKNYDILDSIVFKGHVSETEKYKLLVNADVYVLSSLHEGMGIVVQEAMYVGLPIVSTNIGGQNDLLDNNINALMIDPESPEQLKEALLKLHNDPALRSAMSQNNKEKIQYFYSDIIGKKFEEYLLNNI